MALVWQLAFRYLRGKGSGNAVPILSRISMVAIAVCSGAMIVILSVFNGIVESVQSQYNNFYPDIRISMARGKFFEMDAAKLAAIKQVSGVINVTNVIEDNVFAENQGQQKIITLKGIDNNYFNVNDIRDSIVVGVDSVSAGRPYTAIGGLQIFNELGADVNQDIFNYLELQYPNLSITNPEANPLDAFRTLRVHPAGAFRTGDEFEAKYVLAPLSLTQELFHAINKYSSIEMSVKAGEEEAVKEKLKTLLGTGWKVESRYEQNKTLYLIMSSEKLAIYAILMLVFLIASFNMVGALSMLVLEKQKDIAILKAMGARADMIRKIFLLEGVLWSLIGGLCGILLGVVICLIQMQFGFVKMGISDLPVKIEAGDMLSVIAIIIVVGLLTAWYPSMRATKAIDPTLKSA